MEEKKIKTRIVMEGADEYVEEIYKVNGALKELCKTLDEASKKFARFSEK